MDRQTKVVLRMPDNLYRRGTTWYGRYSVRGELQRVSLHTSDLRESRARPKAIKKEADSEAFGVHDASRWEDGVLAYTAGVLEADALKPATAKRYRVSLRQLDPYFRGKPLPEIAVAVIAEYVELRQTEGATNATIRRDLTTMSRVLAFARFKGLVETNASGAFDRSMIRERRAQIHAPDDATITAAIKVCERERPELAPLIRFLRATGMRAGEALRTTWSEVRGRTLTILETKNGRVRTIDVQPATRPPRGREVRLFSSLPLDTGALAGMCNRRADICLRRRGSVSMTSATLTLSPRFVAGATSTTFPAISGTAR
ncbi:MAG TPA: hypothetical protein VMF62_08170 [Acetobacteraceae bacterium]|nr:hypothetical protein [Acetobacteraceae bacterium]